MAVTVKKIVLWRKEVENRTGILANALAPLAHAGTDIHVVMGYRYPGQESKAAIELYPVAGKKSVTAAKEVSSKPYDRAYSNRKDTRIVDSRSTCNCSRTQRNFSTLQLLC